MIHERQYSLLSRTYAEALFRAARRTGVLQKVQDDCKTLLTVIERSDRLVVFLGNPQVPTENKRDLLDRVFGPRMSPLTIRMLTLMVERERIDILTETLELFQEMIERAEGIHQAQVASAVELSFQDKLRLKNALEKYTGNRLRIEYQVDPGLIGGLVFRFRDVLIDSSLKAGLAKLKRLMLDAPMISVPGAE